MPISGTTAKTGTYTAVAADCGQVLNCTGTWTLTLTSAVTLGDGWNVPWPTPAAAPSRSTPRCRS